MKNLENTLQVTARVSFLADEPKMPGYYFNRTSGSYCPAGYVVEINDEDFCDDGESWYSGRYMSLDDAADDLAQQIGAVSVAVDSGSQWVKFYLPRKD